jgi:hypothetical protein
VNTRSEFETEFKTVDADDAMVIKSPFLRGDYPDRFKGYFSDCIAPCDEPPPDVEATTLCKCLGRKSNGLGLNDVDVCSCKSHFQCHLCQCGYEFWLMQSLSVFFEKLFA